MSRTRKLWLVTLFALLLVLVGFASVAGAQPNPRTVDRPYLGVSLRNTDDGVVIQEVVADSPAEAAGLQADDQITSVNDADVSNAREVVEAIAALAPGDVVTLGITRGDESMTVDATLAEAPAPMRTRTIEISGLSIRYNEGDQTWVIEKLGEDNPLYEAGLREGDVITAVDGEALDPEGLANMMRDGSLDDTHTLTVERDGESMDIDVDGLALHLFMMLGMGDGSLMPMLPQIIIPGQPGRGHNLGPMGMFGAQNGRLGVLFDVLTPEIASDMGLDITEGAVIREVTPDSPAETAGLMADDVVTAVNGEPVDAERTLRDRLFAYEPGDTVTLDVVRGDETLQLEVTLDAPQPTGPMPSGMTLPAIPAVPEVPPTPQTSL
ncbi:MAG: PDZ domain-containing protein [Anaerolineae bacterium]|nr:PDZ domain-containing protein [Anaerolineae bacterium]